MLLPARKAADQDGAARLDSFENLPAICPGPFQILGAIAGE
jgi:hypothetical protein